MFVRHLLLYCSYSFLVVYILPEAIGILDPRIVLYQMYLSCASCWRPSAFLIHESFSVSDVLELCDLAPHMLSVCYLTLCLTFKPCTLYFISLDVLIYQYIFRHLMAPLSVSRPFLCCLQNAILEYLSMCIDIGECLSCIWWCTFQLLDDVGLEAVIFLES